MKKEVKQIIKKYWVELRYPVDPFKIIEQMTDIIFSTNPFLDKNLSGVYNKTTNTITLNNTESYLRQRFTLAHMIGHHVYNYPYVSNEKQDHFSLTYNNEDEQKANQFALQLLIPTDALTAAIYYSNKYGYTTLKDYAIAFQVSRKAMEYRLKETGYLK